MLDCTPGEVEALVMAKALIGRHIKLALSHALSVVEGVAEVTARGRLWIVCAACVMDFQALPPEEREAAIAKAVAQATGRPSSKPLRKDSDTTSRPSNGSM